MNMNTPIVPPSPNAGTPQEATTIALPKIEKIHIGVAGARTIVLSARGRNFRFKCDRVSPKLVPKWIPVNPVLPKNFSSTANEGRPDRQAAWWNVAYIETYACNAPKWVAHWKGTIRYDVRCLDGGAWDRPTCWGQFATLAEAANCVARGPSWMKKEAA